MTYSGSYTRRTAPNTNNQEQRAAKDIEKYRKEFVSDAKGVNQDWKVEQTRLNNLQKIADYAEAQNISNTWKAFDQLVQEGVVPFTKMKWDEAIAEGRKDAKENNKKWKAQLEENKKINDQILATTKESGKLVKKLELGEHKNELLGKGHFYKMGYERQLLDEYVAGFGNHRLDQLATSTELIEGTDVAIKDWRELGSDGYEAASGQIYNNYLRKAPGNFKASYIMTEAIPVMDKAETAQKTQHYRYERISAANIRIEGRNANLQSTFDKELDPTKIAETIEVYVGEQSTDYQLAEKQPGTIIKDLHGLIKNAALTSDGDIKVSDRLVEALSKTTMPGHPAGSAPLSQLHADKFSKEAIEKVFDQAARDKANLDEASRKGRIQNTIKEATEKHTELLINGADPSEIAEYENTTRQALVDLGAVKADFANLENTFKRELMSPEASAAYIDSLAGADGQVSEVDITIAIRDKLLNPEAVEEARKNGQIVETPFLGESDATKQYATSSKTLQTSAIKLSQTRYKNNKDAVLDKSSEIAHEILLKDGITINGVRTPGLARLAQNKYLTATKPVDEGGLGDFTYTKTQALKDAELELISKFNALQKDINEEGNILYNFNGDGFKNISDRFDKRTKFTRSVVRQVDAHNWAVNTIKKEGVEGLLKSSYTGLNEGDWEVGILQGNRPGRMWDIITRAAVKNGYKGTSWDLYNARAAAEDRPTLKLPEEASLLKERLPAGFIPRLIENPGSHTIQNQALEALEVPSKRVIKRVIVRTPRQIRQPHLGPQKKSTFLTDVASVVSDAPREIPQPREQPKGRWVGTGRSKKWVPDNQEGN